MQRQRGLVTDAAETPCQGSRLLAIHVGFFPVWHIASFRCDAIESSAIGDSADSRKPSVRAFL
jgi:hypothetical protein